MYLCVFIYVSIHMYLFMCMGVSIHMDSGA